jgi:cytochrome c oxidase subunit 4
MSSSHPVTSAGLYFGVFFALLILTGVTYWAALIDFGALNTPVALAIAVTKASLVIWFFMGVRFNTPLTKVVVVSGLLWLVIMFVFTLGDYLTRDWMGVPGR